LYCTSEPHPEKTDAVASRHTNRYNAEERAVARESLSLARDLAHAPPRDAFEEDQSVMDLSGSQKFNAPPQQVWNALMNPAVLQASIPGAKTVTVNGNQINIVVNVNVPFLSGEFNLDCTITQQTPPNHAVLAIDRTGSYGSIKGTITMDLAADGPGTNLTYNAHLDLGGKIGMADNMLVKPAVQHQLNNFFKNVESKV
jgi:carbon monoxide dehydrogenase subunit G